MWIVLSAYEKFKQNCSTEQPVLQIKEKPVRRRRVESIKVTKHEEELEEDKVDKEVKFQNCRTVIVGNG